MQRAMPFHGDMPDFLACGWDLLTEDFISNHNFAAVEKDPLSNSVSAYFSVIEQLTSAIVPDMLNLQISALVATISSQRCVRNK